MLAASEDLKMAKAPAGDELEAARLHAMQTYTSLTLFVFVDNGMQGMPSKNLKDMELGFAKIKSTLEEMNK